MSDRLRAWLIVTVCMVWGANFVAPIFIRDYMPAPELNVALMAIIGIITATSKDKDGPPPDGKSGGGPST